MRAQFQVAICFFLMSLPHIAHAGPDQPWNEQEPSASCVEDPACAKLLAQYNKKVRDADIAAQREFDADPIGTSLKRGAFIAGLIGGVIAAYLGVIALLGSGSSRRDEPVTASNPKNVGGAQVKGDPTLARQPTANPVEESVLQHQSPPKVPNRKFACACGAKLFASSTFSGVVVCYKCGESHSIAKLG